MLTALEEENINYTFQQKKDKIAFRSKFVTIPSDTAYVLKLFKQRPEFKFIRARQLAQGRIGFGYEGDPSSMQIKGISDVFDSLAIITSKEPNKDTLNLWIRPRELKVDSLLFEVLNKEKKATNIIMSDPNKKRLNECSKYLKANFVPPNDKSIKENNFDLVLESVGLEITRHQAIKSIAPGGTILHIGLTQPSGTFDFKKLTIQEVTLVGTYCITNKDFQKSLEILKEKKLGDLGWIEYRDLKKGSEAFNEIHNGTCVAPKIILIP